MRKIHNHLILMLESVSDFSSLTLFSSPLFCMFNIRFLSGSFVYVFAAVAFEGLCMKYGKPVWM